MSNTDDTFDDYLERAKSKNVIDFHLRVMHSPEGALDFYIHPEGMNGETASFTVHGAFVTRLGVAAGSSRSLIEFFGSGEK